MRVGSYRKQSAGGVDISVAPADLQAFQQFAQLMPKAVAAAQRRAMNKLLLWLRTHIARAVSKDQRIAVGAVRQRLRSFPVSSGGHRGKLWFGLNALESSRIGRPRETRSGVSVAGRHYRGAFYRKVYGGSADIWIRTASKHFDSADYPDSNVTTGGGVSSGWIAENEGRFPLAKAKVSLESVRPLFHDWVRQADARLLELLRQELNYEMSKLLKGGKHG